MPQTISSAEVLLSLALLMYFSSAIRLSESSTCGREIPPLAGRTLRLQLPFQPADFLLNESQLAGTIAVSLLPIQSKHEISQHI